MFSFPAARAARIAINACNDTNLEVTFCYFSAEAFALYDRLLSELM